MVICNYFLNGNCRFGTKCMNDHVDLKQVIKSDVESCVASNQWPLSCFGPFKEKPSLANFIEDQSFEEIRHYCFEAKNANTLPQFTMELGEKIKDAKNKMQSLLMMTPEIVQEIVKIYNSGTNAKAATPSASNVFGGASTNMSNPFMSTAGGTPTAGSIFGGGTQQSSFGATTPAGNIFGQSQQQQQSVFGAKPSIFGQQQQQQQPSSIFGAAPQATGFGQQPQPAASIFGGASQQPAPASSIFGAAPATTPFGGGGASSIFGGSQAVTAPSIFAPAPAAQVNQFSQPPAVGVFGNAPQVSAFPAPTAQSPFGSVMQQQQPAQPQPAFGGSSLFTPAPSAAWQNSNQGAAPQYGGGMPFGSGQPVQQQQQQQQNQPAPPPPAGDSTIYSQTENLTKEQMEAFQADNFTIGQIPCVPPPRELCS